MTHEALAITLQHDGIDISGKALGNYMCGFRSLGGEKGQALKAWIIRSLKDSDDDSVFSGIPKITESASRTSGTISVKETVSMIQEYLKTNRLSYVEFSDILKEDGIDISAKAAKEFVLSHHGLGMDERQALEAWIMRAFIEDLSDEEAIARVKAFITKKDLSQEGFSELLIKDGVDISRERISHLLNKKCTFGGLKGQALKAWLVKAQDDTTEASSDILSDEEAIIKIQSYMTTKNLTQLEFSKRLEEDDVNISKHCISKFLAKKCGLGGVKGQAIKAWLVNAQDEPTDDTVAIDTHEMDVSYDTTETSSDTLSEVSNKSEASPEDQDTRTKIKEYMATKMLNIKEFSRLSNSSSKFVGNVLRNTVGFNGECGKKLKAWIMQAHTPEMIGSNAIDDDEAIRRTEEYMARHALSQDDFIKLLKRDGLEISDAQGSLKNVQIPSSLESMGEGVV